LGIMLVNRRQQADAFSGFEIEQLECVVGS
jgi:hypothetical protein